MKIPVSKTEPELDTAGSIGRLGDETIVGGSDSAPLLSLRNASKTFGGITVLDDVTLEIASGEIHGLLGQNGSGKSTLIKILSGYHQPDDGTKLSIRGNPRRFPLKPNESASAGISFVHQDLGLVTDLTVAENFFLGSLARRGRKFLSLPQAKRYTESRLAAFGLRIPADVMVGSLSGTERALLAIVRALDETRQVDGDRDGSILVLDEPTAFLPATGVQMLFRLVRDMAAEGAGVLFVSHNLNEVLDLTDRVTVLRDGVAVGNEPSRDCSQAQLVKMIVGTIIQPTESGAKEVRARDVAASVQCLSGRYLRDIAFDLHAGEIVGITGIAGSGFEEVPKALFGAGSKVCGTLTVNGRTVDLSGWNPRKAMREGIALIPGDRANQGSVGSLTVTDNLTLATLTAYRVKFALSRSRMLASSRRICGDFEVRPRDPLLPYSVLSGGNQQKVLVAKWLETQPQLLLLQDPTQGVDVGARSQLYDVLKRAAARGMSILCASSDSDQIADLCDRVLIVADGKIVDELFGAEVSSERIAEKCLVASPMQAHSPDPLIQNVM